MTDYVMKTDKGWLETRSAIADEMRKWGIEEWTVEKFGNGARVSYMRNGRPIDLNMDKQASPAANLRVLFYTVQSLRMNEVRGISEVMQSAYVQIAAPKQKRNPYDVLMILPDSDIEVAEAVFRNLAQKYHPDKGGSVEKFQEINEAIDEIRKEKGK
jgi:hypothetical protein